LIEDVVLGLGLVAILEGLALALAPSHLREVLEAVARMEPEQRRTLGLLAMTVGVGLVWVARG
jgi:uncharacterized protein YjeT (DUF2065 family)